jgi:hypothetical protein
MIPRTISASALDTADKCLARWKASSFDRGAGFGNPAAMLGTTLHAALEAYLSPDMIDKGVWDATVLLELYHIAWMNIWGSKEEPEWYQQGREILMKWHDRPDMYSDTHDVRIISREVKKSFDVPYIDPADGNKKTVPCNYIMDRVDEIDTGVYRVVDYKSQRLALSPEQLRGKIQPRLYALAAQIEYPHAKEIWVQFDFLRYDRVGTLFTKQDNVETWAIIKKAVQRIVDTPDNNVPETLNDDCRYCPRKFTCNTLQSNIRVGGLFSLSVDELANLYYQMKGQQDAIKSITEDVEQALLKYADSTDQLEFDADRFGVKVKSYRRRVVDRDRIAAILGPEIMKEYGRINVGDLDTIRKDPRVSSVQASMLETAVSTVHSEPSIQVTKKVI